MNWRSCISAAVFLCALCSGAAAQTYPSKPIRMLTAFGVGAPGDLLARVIAPQMQLITGQPVVVDSQAGGGGVLAASLLARAAPDGHTVLLMPTSVPVIGVVLSKRALPFDPAKDFAPVTQIAETPLVIVAHAGLAANSLRELIELAKKSPGTLSYGTTGIGSSHHLAAEQIRMLTGAELVHVPYKTAPVVDAATGTLAVAYAVAAQAMPFIKSGKVKVLGVIATRRAASLPDAPLVHEVVPGFEPRPNWTGMFSPANVPPVTLRRLHADTVRAIAPAEVQAKIRGTGFEPATSVSAEAFAAQVKEDIALVARVVKAAGIPPIE